MAKTARELRQVRKYLTDEQIVAVLRALNRESGRPDSDRPLAVGMVNEHLDQSEPLDEIFEPTNVGSEEIPLMFGFYIDCKRQRELKFEITFGCGGGTAGDGGTWLVTFNESGEIESIENEGFCIH